MRLQFAIYSTDNPIRFHFGQINILLELMENDILMEPR